MLPVHKLQPQKPYRAVKLLFQNGFVQKLFLCCLNQLNPNLLLFLLGKNIMYTAAFPEQPK